MSFTHSPAGRIAATGPCSAAEEQTRIDLAAAYRLAALNGWDDLVYTHISASVPDEPGHFLINPFGLTFDEVCASNLVKIDTALLTAVRPTSVQREIHRYFAQICRRTGGKELFISIS